MDFNQLIIFISHHENILIGVSEIIEISLIISFVYFFFQLGKEENKDTKKRSKILSKLIFIGLCVYILGLAVTATSLQPAILQ